MVITYREALNQAMREEMRRDDRVFLIGEEVGYYQGAFKVSKGFAEEFGPGRVLDTPITEAGFTGLAIGAAMAGLGAQIADSVYSRAFDYLDAPVVRVTGEDVPMPYARPLEDAAIPDQARIVAAIREVLYERSDAV